MMMVIHNKTDIGAIGVKECLEDDKLEKVIREQRVVALQVSLQSILAFERICNRLEFGVHAHAEKTCKTCLMPFSGSVAQRLWLLTMFRSGYMAINKSAHRKNVSRPVIGHRAFILSSPSSDTRLTVFQTCKTFSPSGTVLLRWIQKKFTSWPRSFLCV